MPPTTLRALLSISLAVGLARASCPNACSGHGSCGSYDQCTCDRNWQGADCSLRTCPFGQAHVDSPKGDLDMSNSIESFGDNLVAGSTTYPFGTTEMWPDMADTAGTVLDNTAHNYMECSNKGLCDRLTGQCECLAGYDGQACQRASCPSKVESINSAISAAYSSNVQSTIKKGLRSSFMGRAKAKPMLEICSGHGTCESIADLAAMDQGNVYALWDKDASMACKCDSGYGGPDCAQRQCMHGIDPLYTDDATARVTHTTVRFETSDASALSGEYALKFWDSLGEDYITSSLELDGTGAIGGKTHCEAVVGALKALPNGVVPEIDCSQTVIDTNRGFEYVLKFTGNAGRLRELEIEDHLDGSRSTVEAATGTVSFGLYTKVTGEFEDFFPWRCEGVTVKVLADSSDVDNSWNADVRPGSLGYLSGPGGDLSPAEAKKLKRCLGDSDWDGENNVDVANWDKGFTVEADGAGPTTYNMIGAFPHAIKVVQKETTAGYDQFSYGKYYLLWFDETAAAGKQFRVANLNDGNNLLSEATESYVYTTSGTVQQLGHGSEPDKQISDNSGAGSSSKRIVGHFGKYSNRIYTNYDTSCENDSASAGDRNHRCVEKGDLLFLVDGCWGGGDGAAGTVSPFFGGPDVTHSCPDISSVNYDTGNLYTVRRVYKAPMAADSATGPSDPDAGELVNTNIIEVDASLGWDGASGQDPENTGNGNTGLVTLFHFSPPSGVNEKLPYVSECSGRGNCDRETGLCNCFQGYWHQDCSVQNSMAGQKTMIAGKTFLLGN